MHPKNHWDKSRIFNLNMHIKQLFVTDNVTDNYIFSIHFMADFFKDKGRKDHYVSKIICIQNGIMMR